MHSSILPLTSADDIATVLKSDNVEVLKLGLPRLQLTLSLSISPQTDPVEREKLERIVFAYISKNPDLSDLFSIWDLANQNNITRVEVLVIDIIIAFLHLTDSALTRNTCNSIQREVLRNRNTTIHRNLSNGTHIIIASTLKLIIALNQRGAQTVRDVLVELNLTMKVFGKFAGMRLSKSNDRSGEDVRSVYINFVLSFLEYGDSLTKKQILEMKDIMGGILKGLARDSSMTVSRILQVMLNNIIRDSDLSRTVKVNFFNNWVLDQLATLYQTTGESKNSTSPAKLVHDFFLEICTSPNVGVCFRDNGWYSPHSENEDEISNGYSEKSIIQSDQQNSKDRSNKRFKVYNKILSLFVMSLNPTEDELQAELLLKILENCPELVASYLQNTTLNLDPRPNLRYLSSMTLLTRIISLPIPAFFHHTQTAAAPLPAPPPLTTILLNVSPIPSPIPRITFSKALQHDSPMIKYSSLLLLAAVIQKFDDVYDKLDEYAKFWERRSHGDRITYESGSGKAVQLWNDMKSRLLMEMKKRLPEFQVLVGLGTWCNSQITKFSTSGYHNPNPGTDGISATKAKNHIDSDMEVCGEETAETQPSLEEFELTTLEKTEMVYCCILKILKGYQKLLPDVVIESRFDMGKLVPFSLSKVSETTQSFVLEFLLECRDFKWLNKNDEPNTHLATVLTLHLTSARNSSIRELTSRVLTSWFTSFIGFQYVPNEPEIWVSTLPCSLDANSAHIQNINTVIHALIESVSKNPYNHIDTLSESLSNVEAENKISSPFDINTSPVEESEILEILRDSLHHTISYYKSRQLLPISPMFMEFLSSYALHCDTQIELEYFKILVRVVYLNQMVPEFMEYLVGRMADVEIRSTIYSCLSSDPYGPDVPSDSVQDVKRLLFSIYEQRHRCDSHLVNDVFRRIAEVQDFTTDANIRTAICSIVLNHPVVAAIWSRFSDQFCQVCEFLAKLIATCLASDGEIDTDIVAKSKLFKDQLIEKVLDDIRMNMELPNMILNLASIILPTFSSVESTTIISTILSCSDQMQIPQSQLQLMNYLGSDVSTNSAHRKRVLYLHTEILPKLIHVINRTSLSELDFETIGSIILAILQSNYISPWVKSSSLITESLKPMGELAMLSSLFRPCLIDAFLERLTSTNSKILAQLGFVHKDIRQLILTKISHLSPVECEKSFKNLVIVLFGCARGAQFIANSRGNSDDRALELLKTVAAKHQVTEKLLKRSFDSESQEAEEFTDVETKTLQLFMALLFRETQTLDMQMKLEWTFEIIAMPNKVFRWVEFETSMFFLNIIAEQNRGEGWREKIVERWLRTLANALMKGNCGDRDIQIANKELDKVIASRTDWDFQYFSPEIIKGVIVTILKHGYAEPSSMLLLTRVVTCIYRHLLNQPLSSVRLIEMTLSHSQFLPLIINLDAITSAPPEVASRVKTAVIYFLYTLIKIDPIEHCKPEFVPSLLSAYSATLAPSDQLIFEILTLYESSMSLSRSTLLWGPSSFHLRRQLQLDSSTPKFLVSINTVIESISQLDSTWLAHTVRQFPTQISLQSPIHGLARVVENFLKGDLVANKPIYDPRYMLPLFVGYMKFGSQVDARKYIEMNAVGLAVAALSSADQSMRRLGYIVLDEYFSLFETSSFREKPQIQLLLNSVKNSIADRSTPQRLPSMISTFIAQALSILLKPDHLMYSNINRFLLQRPILDLEDIPMFYSLIHSSSEQFSKERLWMMRLLACGLKDSMDLQLYKRRHAWDIICSYFDSTLVDGLTKKIALEIVGKITTIPTALHDLMLHHGLLPWLHHITSSVACSNFKLADVTSILLLTRIFRRLSVVILSPINDNYTSDGTPRWKHQTTYIHQISLILLSCLKQLKGLMPVIGRNEDTTAILWNIVYEVSKLLRLAVEYEVPPTANVREGIEAPHVILQPLTLQLISIFRDLVNASLYTEGSDFKQDHLIRLAQVSDDKVSTSLEFITLSSQSDLLEILCFVDPDILKIQKFAVETLCSFIISIHADDSLGHRRAYNDDVNWILNWGWSKFELEKVAEWLCEVDT